MFRQAVYRKVAGPGTTPTAGAFALAGIIAPADFDHRSQLQRRPLAPVGDAAMSRPPAIPGRADVVWISRSARLDPFFRYVQRAPLAQVGDAAMSSPPAIPDLQTVVAIGRSARSDPAWRQLFEQVLPITPAVVILPAVAFPPLPFYADFYKPSWNPAYWLQARARVAQDLAPVVTGGGPRRIVSWTPIHDIRTLRRFGLVGEVNPGDDEAWLTVALAAGMTPAEAVLLYALAAEDE